MKKLIGQMMFLFCERNQPLNDENVKNMDQGLEMDSLITLFGLGFFGMAPPNLAISSQMTMKLCKGILWVVISTN